jgi:hypothetical protein
MKRISILGLMAVVALLGVGLAAMRDGSALAENAASLGLFLALGLGLIGAIVRRGSPAWVGFTVLAGAYTLTSYVPESEGGAISRGMQVACDRFGLDTFLNALTDRLYEMPAEPSRRPFAVMTGPNGEMLRQEGSRVVPLTDLELAELRSYEARRRAYASWYATTRSRRERAVEIGHVLTALLLGGVGSLAGRLLAIPNPSPREPAPAGIRPATEEPAR